MLGVVQRPGESAEHPIWESIGGTKIAYEKIHMTRIEVVAVVYVRPCFVQNGQAATVPAHSGMVVDHPRILVEADHGKMTLDNALVHLNEVTRYRRILEVELPVGLPELFPVRLQGCVFLGIDKSRVEKEREEVVQVYAAI